MLKNIPILEIIKDEVRKYQLYIPDQAQAAEVMQVLSEMFGWVSNQLQQNMQNQVPKPDAKIEPMPSQEQVKEG